MLNLIPHSTIRVTVLSYNTPTLDKKSDNLGTSQSTYTIQSLLLPSHLLDGCIWDLTHLLKQCFADVS